eukprot:c15327_g1_i1 orf=445-1509(+)
MWVPIVVNARYLRFREIYMASSWKKAWQNSSLLVRRFLQRSYSSPLHFRRVCSRTASRCLWRKSLDPVGKLWGFPFAGWGSASELYGTPITLHRALIPRLTRFLHSIRSSQSPVRGIALTYNSLSVQGMRRYYYVYRNGPQRFPMGGPRSWLEGPGGHDTRRRMLILVMTACGLCVWVYVSHLEDVSYTYRRHFVLVSPRLERTLGEENFKMLKQQLKGQILPPTHPLAIRVRKIAKDIIQAVMEGVKAEDWGEMIANSESLDTERVPLFWGQNGGELSSPMDLLDKQFQNGRRGPRDEHLNDSWIDRSRRKGLNKHRKPFTKHLEGIKWEILVVNADILNAFCLPGGKIVVFT